MISVQVTFTASECVTQFIQHVLHLWDSEACFPEHFDQGRLPAAVNAPPAIPCEAENTETPVIHIISPLGARATTYIMLTLPGAAVLFASATGSEFGTARGGAGAQDCPWGLRLRASNHAQRSQVN